MTIPPQLDKHRTLGVLQPPASSRVERRRAALFVASTARGTADCAQLLDMLGLDPSDGKQATSTTGEAA